MAPLEVTRSSKAILKESLFNTLGTSIVNTNFIEFFAGSGSIGIEALSRGAKEAIFFEQNSQSYKILLENLQNVCKQSKYQTFKGDTFSLYQNALMGLKGESIAYFDPPFDIRENMQEIYTKCFEMIKNLDSKIFKIIVMEHISNLQPPQNLIDFSLEKTKKFGKSSLSYYLA